MSLSDSVNVTFVYETTDEMTLPVRIQLLGRPADYDREIEVRVTSENALEEIDYNLPEDAYIPAGKSYTDYNIVLKRTPSLRTEEKVIEIEILPNQNFTLPVTEIKQGETAVPVLRYRIFFSDMFTNAPVAWDINLVGTFTQQKFELICKVLQIDPDDFNDPSRITLAKLLYISSEMTSYVNEEVEKKNNGEKYDPDAFDHETGEPLYFYRID